eukprot:TRINITY_DN142_c0_g1_i16.p2 TRINITY_DN142_c0_g1~~TRINITY_DN142_c0_g1_i16.p2  ORF type:complete len:149 (-),score=13.47 TRINITY_DN142_c0_g1_i16:2240-2686(-)
MKLMSSPGPDTLQVCIYQLDSPTFASLLLPTFQEIFTYLTQMEEFTRSITTLVLDEVISLTQIGYRPKRRLHEHILLFDLHMERNPNHFFLWVDFSKAFDSIAHNYLFGLLELLQFPVQRGSRQRDPISGYLFNIALDLLNSMIPHHL